MYRLPNSLCTDRGRKINNSELGWEETLEGRLKHARLTVHALKIQMWLQNSNVVYLRLKARRQGLALSLGADGMVVRLGT